MIRSYNKSKLASMLALSTMAATGYAANTDVGTIVEQQVTGSSSIHVAAADAIRATCGGLVNNTDGETRTAQQGDLLTNCGDMAGSILRAYESPNSAALDNAFNFDAGNPQATLNSLLQFSGEEVSSQGRYATDAAGRNTNTIAGRLSSIRQGLRGSGVAYNLNGTDLSPSATADAGGQYLPFIGGNAGDAGSGGLGWFANVEYGFGERDGSINEDEFEYDSIGVTFGLDYDLGNGWVLGGAFSYDDNEIEFENGGFAISQVAGGEIEADGFLVSAFAMYSSEAPLYYSGIVSYGSHDHDMTRNIMFTTSGVSSPNRVLTGDTESDQTSAQLTIGSVLGSGATTFDVSASLDWLDIEIDGFDEQEDGTGGLALSYADQDIESFRAVIAGTVRHSINNNGTVIVPYAGLSWYNEFDNDERIIEARYRFAVAGFNPSFEIPTDDPDDSYGQITLGISAQFRNNLFMFLQWDTAIAFEDVTSNIVSVGIRGTF